LRRTRETAQAIADHLPGTPAAQPCDWLREIDHGPDENATEDAVLARIGAQALADWDERGCPRPGGRSMRPRGWPGGAGCSRSLAVPTGRFCW
jgi:probable phosphoglycerate mutase